jgi:hypothetical protein
MKHTERIVGASESLNRTISELMEYMDDQSSRPNADLRQFMYDKIADLAEWWANEGFYWGHGTACQHWAEDGEVPATLVVDYGNARLAPGCERALSLRSRIRRDTWRS